MNSSSKSISIVVVEKSGKLVEKKLATNNDTELYKYAGLKSKNGFEFQTEWNLWNIKELENKTYNIFLHGKTTGRAGQENKYDFPPPVDNNLYFGSCVLINKNKEGELQPLRLDEWERIYDYLFGGFEDINDEDSEILNDDTEYDETKLTKTGYIKDDFIVDDDEENVEDDDEEDVEDEDEEDEEDNDEDIENNKKSKYKKPSKKTPLKKTPVKKGTSKTNKTNKKCDKKDTIDENSLINIYDLNELEEEEYV